MQQTPPIAAGLFPTPRYQPRRQASHLDHPAIKSLRNIELRVGHSGGLRGEKKIEEEMRRDVCLGVFIWLTVWRLKGGEEAFFSFFFFLGSRELTRYKG